MAARFLRTLAVLVTGPAFIACTLWGQSSSGTITGRLFDPAGQAVPGATLTLTRTDTGEVRTFTSDTIGEFIFTSIQPGPYDLTAKADGFKITDRKGLSLSAS